MSGGRCKGFGKELDEDEGEEAAAGEALELDHRPRRGPNTGGDDIGGVI